MRLHLKLAGIAVALAISPLVASAQTSVTTDPVGFFTLTIHGHGGVAPSALSFIGVSMTQPVAYQGSVDSFSGSTITQNSATWADDAFDGANGPYFLEITSGSHAGLMLDIVSTTASTKTLGLSQPVTSYLTGGETFKIRKHWTLASLFGTAGSGGSTVLGGGASSADADEILVYDHVSGSYDGYYNKVSGFGTKGWRSENATTTGDMSGVVLYIDEGIIIRRKQPADVSVQLVGSVKTGPTMVAINPGLNFVSNVYPAGALSLGTAQLYTANASTGLAGGTISSADLVQVYNGSSYDSFFYKNAGFGGTGWRLNTSSVDMSGSTLASGGCVIVNRKTAGSFFWTIPQPF